MLDIYSPRRAFEITPDDVVQLDNVTRYVYVGSTGDLTVILASDSASVTFKAVHAGTLLPIRVKFVLTSSTASDLVGLY